MGVSITGISSGLDTAGMIQQLMQVESIPYGKLEDKHSMLNAKQGVFRSINTKLSALRTAAFDLTSSGAWQTKQAVLGEDGSKILSATVGDNALTSKYNVKVEKLALASSYASQSINRSTDATTLNGQTLKIYNGSNSLAITIQDASTMDDVLNQIVGQINGSNIGISASSISTSSNGKTLALFSKGTGFDNELSFGDAANGTKRVLDISDSLSAALGLAETQKAQDAEIVVNGVRATSSGNKFENIMDGLSLVANAVGQTTVDVQSDTSKLVSQVEAFVKAYNGVIQDVRGYTAKGAALQGNSTLRTLGTTLNNLANIAVGAGTLKDIPSFYGLEIDKGITTASLMTGAINFDKSKLLSKLEADPEKTKQFLTSAMSAFDNTLKTWTQANTGIMASAIKGYDSEISANADAMAAMDMRLSAKEARLKAQFSNMEVLLSGLNNQKSWLTNQLASLNSLNSNK
ncbi:Flagellar hook-associated protein 2 [compost metagenome]